MENCRSSAAAAYKLGLKLEIAKGEKPENMNNC